MARYEVISNPSFTEIEAGDTIQVTTAWGRGKSVYGRVLGKEKDFMGDRNVVDYHIEGNKLDNWAYDYQITKLIKEC